MSTVFGRQQMHTDAPRATAKWFSHLPITVLLGTIFAFLFVIPALARLTDASTALAGALAALPSAMLVYATFVLLHRGKVAVPSVAQLMGPLGLWSLLLTTSMLRSNNPSHVGYASVLLGALWLFLAGAGTIVAYEVSRHRDSVVDGVLKAFALGAGIFVIANLALHFLGISGSRTLLIDLPEGSLARMFGLRVERTLMPLASGVNNFGTIAGLAIATSLSLFLSSKVSLGTRVVLSVLLAGCILALFLTDSRGPLLFGVIAGASVPMAFRTRFGGLIRWVAFAAPVLPIALLAALALLARTDAARALSRQQGDLASATGRVIVWTFAAGRLVTQPSPTDVIGYGQYGPKGEGISAAWGPQFKGFMDDPTLISTHNLSLQLVYDMGYLGYAIVLLTIWWALGRLYLLYRLRGLSGAVSLAAGLLFILLAGTTEATIAIGFPEILVFFTFSIAFTTFLTVSSTQSAAAQPVAR